MRCRFDPVYPEHWRRTSSRDPDIRASDAERTQVADRLSRHFADGRLDQSEFKARLDRAMGATTRGDLEGLFDDLPPVPEDAPPPRRHRRFFRALLVVALVVVVLSWTLPWTHVGWVPAVLVALVLWRVLGGHHRSHESFTGGEHAQYDRWGPRP